MQLIRKFLSKKFVSNLINSLYILDMEFDPDAAESLIHSLYILSDHKNLIEYIVLSYRQQCDDDVLGNIYELMLEEMHHSFDE